MDLRIRGVEQLGDLSKRLRAAGEDGKGLRRELLKGMQRATRPLKADAKRAAGDRLPQAGGLAAEVARAKFTTRTRTGRNPSVAIVAKGDVVRSSDRGRIRHPVFGNRKVWVTQDVPPGWFTETMQDSAPKVRREIIEAMETVARQIARG